MIAAGILPFSLVEQPGFIRFCKIIQPRYSPPGRRHFSQFELPEAYSEMKEEIDDFLIPMEDEVSMGSTEDFFSNYEKEKQGSFMFQEQLRNPTALEKRQKSEVEVNEFLRDSKLKVGSSPSDYWKVNSEKWPLLGKLVRKYHCAPATSSESERLFSTAGLIANDLRKNLLPENLEMLLTLHHNLLIYNFNYCLK
uniref:Dimer_Tnp_hAT domain-containing protein n=1 Tax=Meloidogyne hapla TaxID=6305 RepID=A0A1I8B9I1_MELHA